jgi:ferredoxin
MNGHMGNSGRDVIRKGSALLARWLVLAALFLPQMCLAQGDEQKKQAPPEFTSYQIPGQTIPLPRAEIFLAIDVAILIAMLCLTAYYTLKLRSRSGVRMLSVFSLLYFGFYRGGCVCAIGAIQNVALALFHNSYALPLAVAAFFIVPLIFTIFFGRVFCASVCPLGAMQELALLRPQNVVPTILDSALKVIPYLYLGLAVLLAGTGSAFIICRYDPFVSFFRLGGRTDLVVISCIFLLMSTVIGRPYCRYVCPYSVLLRWLAPLAKWKADVTPSKCVNCHLCATACPFGALRAPNLSGTGAVSIEPAALRRKWASILLVALPFVVVATAFLGYKASPELSQFNATVVLANRVWTESTRHLATRTLESAGFATIGGSPAKLYHDAALIRRKFDIGSTLLGAWFGIVVMLKLILTLRRQDQTVFQADPGNCYACARCYAACPVEQDRLAAYENLPERIPLEPANR